MPDAGEKWYGRGREQLFAIGVVDDQDGREPVGDRRAGGGVVVGAGVDT